MLIEQQPHELGDGDDRVGVVELEDDLVGQPPQVEVLGEGPLQIVAQRAGGKEVLLLQAQLPALRGRVLRVEDLGDVLREGLGADRLDVVARVEDRQVEGPSRLGAPQPQRVDDAVAIARDHVVVGDSQDVPGGDPVSPGPSVGVGDILHMAGEVDLHRSLRVGELPGRAEREPRVRQLDLAAVDDRLPEDPVFVADAVAHTTDVHRRQRVDETRSQPTKPAIAQTWLDLLRAQRSHVQPARTHRPFGDLGQAGRLQGVAELPTEQELGGQVAHHLRGLGATPGRGLEPIGHEVVPDRPGQRQILVVDRRTTQACSATKVELPQELRDEAIHGALWGNRRFQGTRIGGRERRPNLAVVQRRCWWFVGLHASRWQGHVVGWLAHGGL